MTGTGSEPDETATGLLRLLCTTDLHMNLTGFDYSSNQPNPGTGLTRTASLIAAARAKADQNGAAVVLLDNGDALQGSPLGDRAITDAASGEMHPLMRAFSHLRYDTIGLGNHDFNFGLKPLEKVLDQAPCSVIASNLRRLESGILPKLEQHAVLSRDIRIGGQTHKVRIGVLSLLPPQTVLWDANLLQGRVAVDDIVRCAAEHVPALRAAGCAVVVVLAHTGVSDYAHVPGQENAVIPLAAVPGIDAIFAGHTHLVLPGSDHQRYHLVNADAGTIYDTPVAMAGYAGSHLAQIDLRLALDRDKGWRIVESSSSVHAVAQRDQRGQIISQIAGDAELGKMLAPYHEETLKQMRQPVGQSPRTLHSCFALVSGDAGLRLIASAQARGIAPYLQDLGCADLPLLSAAAPAKFGGRSGPRSFTQVPAGTITRRHIEDLVPFPNELRAIIVTGQNLRDWLEMAVSLFNQMTPGEEETELLDPDWPGNAFDVIYGLGYRIDLSAPPRFQPDGQIANPGAERIRDLLYQDQPVARDREFVVALNSYRANGGGNVAALQGARHLQLPRLAIRDVLTAYLEQANAPTGYDVEPWSFVPIPGKRVMLHTCPSARQYLHELADRDVRDCGTDPMGFLQLSLRL